MSNRFVGDVGLTTREIPETTEEEYGGEFVFKLQLKDTMSSPTTPSRALLRRIQSFNKNRVFRVAIIGQNGVGKSGEYNYMDLCRMLWLVSGGLVVLAWFVAYCVRGRSLVCLLTNLLDCLIDMYWQID